MNLNTCTFQEWAAAFYTIGEYEKAACRGNGFWWFDSSILQDYRHCPRYAFFRHALRRAEEFTNPTALSFGTFIHDALAIYHMTESLEEALKVVLQFPDAWADDRRSPELFVKIIRGYAARWGHDIKILKPPEGSFSLPFDADVMYVGRLDMPLVEWEGELFGFEHKTSSLWTLANTQALVSSAQVRGYTYALREYYPEAKGMVVNIIRVAKTGQDYQRIRALYNDWQLEEWYNDTFDETQRMILAFRDGTWPQWWTCYYYNRLCGYHDACIAPNVSVMLSVLEGKPISEWHPYDALKGKEAK